MQKKNLKTHISPRTANKRCWGRENSQDRGTIQVEKLDIAVLGKSANENHVVVGQAVEACPVGGGLRDVGVGALQCVSRGGEATRGCGNEGIKLHTQMYHAEYTCHKHI